MNTSSLMTVLSRFAWFLSFSLWLFFAYLISDVYSYTYMTGTENFFSWGWIWAIVFTLITKKVFLSDSFLSSNIADLNQKGIIHEIWSSLIEDVTSDIQGIRTSNQSLTDENTPESIYTPIESEEIKTTPPVYIPPEPDKPNWIVTFFSDRPLAKIGWIILFLAAFFFLSLVWTNVGAIGKVIIWLVFGFSLYGIWVWMDKKRTYCWISNTPLSGYCYKYPYTPFRKMDHRGRSHWHAFFRYDYTYFSCTQYAFCSGNMTRL